MKNILLFSLMLPIVSVAQSRTINDILSQKEVKKKRYQLETVYLDAIVINMSFGESAVISMMDKANLKDADVFQVDVVYTDYPREIDLNNLNRQRIVKVLEARKDLVLNERVNWRLIRQMDCKSEAEAKTLFHGIVIHYRPAQGAKIFGMEQHYYESVLPKNDSITIKKEVFKQFRDSTVVAVLGRNKQWKSSTVVTDVTCSMSPYVSQLVLWFLYKLNHKETTNFVLFNDGDGKPNHMKIIGKTGGLYSESINDYGDLLILLNAATSKGCSGDSEENGIEAILKAQELFPNSKEIIFIADNYADMRDFELISKIKTPVRVILCGTHFFVNTQYLELAMKTGGSVHSIEQDLFDLSKLVEGKTFTFNRQMYIFKNGKIIPFKNT